jgi:hypothetical protein
MTRRGERARLAVLLTAALLSGGCAGVLRSYHVAPSGLQQDEDRLRRLLAGSQAPAAFERVRRDAPGDEMLHALYHGILAYHAGEYLESARVLDIAAHIADERMTKSISRSAFSLITNDLVLPYEPGPTERLMIPYYAGMARLRAGDLDGAAVEARRLSQLLQRYDDGGPQLAPGMRATLRYVAGAIFELAGEQADADVAYRNAFAADSTLRALHEEAQPGTGSVIVVLEQGFVAHRVEQGLAVLLLPEEVDAIAHGDTENRAAVSAFVAARVLERAGAAHAYAAGPQRGGLLHVPAPERSVVPRTKRRLVCQPAEAAPAVAADSGKVGRATPVSAQQTCTEKEEPVDELPYLLKVAWPVYRSEYRPQRAVVSAAGTDRAFAATADVSRGVVADFDAERALIVARTIARGAAKLALTKGAERKLEEKNEAAGRVLGVLGNIGNVLTERADTRSWHLLPASISVIRVRLPEGTHDLAVTTAGAAGGRPASTGPLNVRAGHTTLVPVRIW